MALAALQEGKDVYIEKPISHVYDAGPLIMDAANKYGRVVQRGSQMRRMFRDDGNGEIGDDGIHDLDMATWGLDVDSLPKQITARGSRMLIASVDRRPRHDNPRTGFCRSTDRRGEKSLPLAAAAFRWAREACNV